jgi:predicted transcriptional regulator
MCYMANETLTVRIEASMREELDAIAAAQDRDRSYIVKEAIRTYVDLHHWQLEHIRQGIRDLDEGRIIPEAAMKKKIARMTRR